jgi:hypothetical protein
VPTKFFQGLLTAAIPHNTDLVILARDDTEIVA